MILRLMNNTVFGKWKIEKDNGKCKKAQRY